MLYRIHNIFITLFAVLLLSVGSVTSATMMAQSYNEIATRAEIAAMGLSPSDICGDTRLHEHRCPFCCLVEKVTVTLPTELAWHCIYILEWKQSADLHRKSQERDYSCAPRAPPSYS